jgi:hypothetical protein
MSRGSCLAYISAKPVSFLTYSGDERAYTTRVLKNSPSPTPTMHLPAINMPRLDAPASIAAPMLKARHPIAIARGRPKRSDKAPANNDANVAARSRQDTSMPWRADGRLPKVNSKDGMVVTGPITPVSRLFQPLLLIDSIM